MGEWHMAYARECDRADRLADLARQLYEALKAEKDMGDRGITDPEVWETTDQALARYEQECLSD